MITKSAFEFIGKYAAVDEDQLDALMYDLRDRNFGEERTIGTLPTSLYRSVRKVRSNHSNIPKFVVDQEGKEHLWQRRIIGKDNLTPHEVAQLLRLIIDGQNGKAHESWHTGYPAPAIAVPDPVHSGQIAFAVLKDDPEKRVSLRTAFYAPEADLEKRLLAPKPGKERLAASIKTRRESSKKS